MTVVLCDAPRRRHLCSIPARHCHPLISSSWPGTGLRNHRFRLHLPATERRHAVWGHPGFGSVTTEEVASSLVSCQAGLVACLLWSPVHNDLRRLFSSGSDLIWISHDLARAVDLGPDAAYRTGAPPPRRTLRGSIRVGVLSRSPSSFVIAGWIGIRMSERRRVEIWVFIEQWLGNIQANEGECEHEFLTWVRVCARVRSSVG